MLSIASLCEPAKPGRQGAWVPDAVAVAVASVTVHSACESIATLLPSRIVWGISCQIRSLSEATAGYRAACIQSTLAGSHAWIPGLKATIWLHSRIHARELQHTSACAAGYTQAPKPAAMYVLPTMGMPACTRACSCCSQSGEASSSFPGSASVRAASNPSSPFGAELRASQT